MNRMLAALAAALGLAVSMAVPAVAADVPGAPPPIAIANPGSDGTVNGESAAVDLLGSPNAEGGTASADGGDATATNNADVDQSTQISGRDSRNDSQAGSGGDSGAAVCNGGGNDRGSDTCDQDNDSEINQTANAQGGDGGSVNGNGMAVAAVGGSADGGGGDVSADGGGATASNNADVDQSNQISGRDSLNDSQTGGSAAQDPAVCNGGGNDRGSDTCDQDNDSTINQTADAQGGDGGSLNGNAIAVAAGPGASTYAEGDDVSANGGDADASNNTDVDQSNQISGRDSLNDSQAGGGGGDNWSAVCNGGGNDRGSDTCDQDNDSEINQTANAQGGDGASGRGNAIGVAVGPGAHSEGQGGTAAAVGPNSNSSAGSGETAVNVVGVEHHTSGEPSRDGDGGDATASNNAEVDQSNQVSGRDSLNDSSASDGGDNWSAVCNGGHNDRGSDTCDQDNDSEINQTANAGSEPESKRPPVVVDSFGGYDGGGGGDNTAVNVASSEQSNQISGRDSLNDSWRGGGSAPDPSFVCNGGHNDRGSDTCDQDNDSTINQTANAGSEPESKRPPVVVDSFGGWDGGRPSGDNTGVNVASSEQSNQVSGRDSLNDSSASDGGDNWSAVCNGGHNDRGSDTCDQDNDSTINQTATAGGAAPKEKEKNQVVTLGLPGGDGTLRRNEDP